MLDSMKDSLAEEIIFVERVRTLLFLSMGLERPISVLIIKGHQKINEGIVKVGVVISVSGASGPEWKRCTNGSFRLDTDEKIWNKITDVQSVSFSGKMDPVEFHKHEKTITRMQHLQMIMGTFGRSRLNLEIDDDNDSKYYRIISEIAGARFEEFEEEL
jgi:hypothetical protein